MNTNLLKHYTDKKNTYLSKQIDRIIKDNPWFKSYLQFTSYDDDLGWEYSGYYFDSIYELKGHIFLEQGGQKRN